MTKLVPCKKCGRGTALKRHCKGKYCPWTKCFRCNGVTNRFGHYVAKDRSAQRPKP
jgi:hypothetical protein